MDLDPSSLIAHHTHRGLRYQLFGLIATLALALSAMLAARTNPLSAVLVVMSGIGFVFAGRSLRASGALLQHVQPPSPKWISRLVPITFVAGLLLSAAGVWILFEYWHPVSLG